MSKPTMTPSPGERLTRFVGDRLSFALEPAPGVAQPGGWQARLRTTLGRASAVRRQLIECVAAPPELDRTWHDVPMRWDGRRWVCELVLAEVGFGRAKAYLVDPEGWQHWPEGADAGVCVHPDWTRSANTIYCAFTRMFGPGKDRARTTDDAPDSPLRPWDDRGYSVIPPSGTFRDLIGSLPHILDKLGCRVLHLLPVNPTPTTYARFGRFGSPYAALDLIAIDPALAEFDRRTTAVDQFRELAYAVHRRGAKLFLDLVVNHTGWGSTLQNERPEWFLRNADGTFASPGAWGNTWADLVELEPKHAGLWLHLAEAFLTWCRRGVDGFRCDAGYKVPMPVWRYITARVHDEFPETVFLLEGLGGAWWDTENLLTDGGMQWAYSELFQEYAGPQISGYLDHALRQSQRVGALVHYSETHDNPRLAARGRAWSLLRNRLCALTSVQGGFGFTCGVEWLAQERVNVHASRGLAWGSAENLVGELAALNRLLAEHPAFFDGATLARLSDPGGSALGLLRQAAGGDDAVLVVINTDADKPQKLTLDRKRLEPFTRPDTFFRGTVVDLLGQTTPEARLDHAGNLILHLGAGAAYCLATRATPRGLAGEAYRRERRQAAWALEAASAVLLPENVGPCAWTELARWVAADPARYLGALAHLDCAHARRDLLTALHASAATDPYLPVVEWTMADRRRITLVPPAHWLLLRDTAPFRACMTFADQRPPRRVQSVPIAAGHAAWIGPWLPPYGGACPRPSALDAQLVCERYADGEREVSAPLRLLTGAHIAGPAAAPSARAQGSDIALLTNGRGGMSRLAVDLGRVQSKYDALLAANLDPHHPVDRHVFAKRLRVWADADGFITPLDERTRIGFESGPPATWTFRAPAGDNGFVTLRLRAGMVAGQNVVVLRFDRGDDELEHRPRSEPCGATQPRVSPRVRLTVRLDLEDRNFHWETKRSGGAEHHFTTHTQTLADGPGYAFTPEPGRRLRVRADRGRYHVQPEWAENIPHPVEQSRGQVPCGDAYSPGWFELPLDVGQGAQMIVSAEPGEPGAEAIAAALAPSAPPRDWPERLERALEAFVARRGAGKTVVAGYPWFLDWGRDTLICARGLIAAGRHDDVREILATFGRFERDGTLPNSIHGGDASNRDTSDAPLWYALACEELAAALAPAATAIAASSATTPARAPECAKAAAQIPYSTAVDPGGRTILDVLRSIASGYLRGTPNGIRVDPESGLVWSPSHFTWMDTNHPAGTPRQGFPIDIQALWIQLLHQLDRLGAPPIDALPWAERAARATAALHRHFWLETQGYMADGLWVEPGRPAREAVVDTALRSNMLLPVALGLVDGVRARRCVAAALRHLVVPGALRSLAPLPVTPPLPIRSHDGRILNDPDQPYCGRYEGDEDTHRKPAYHNGTAWTWTFPGFCEALARAWDFAPTAVAAARAYLTSADRLLDEGCLGQLPEIVDGDAPHTQRGCDAQAWGASEALRVWRLLASRSLAMNARRP